MISDSYQKAAKKAIEIIEGMSIPLELSDRASLLKSATTSLSSKVFTIYIYISNDYLQNYKFININISNTYISNASYVFVL